MAGAGGQEVGRISVRVVPNTDRFRQELKAQLEAIEKSVKCVIDVEPNLKGFRAKVKAATSNLPDATVDVNANTQKLRDSVRKSTDGIQLQLDDKFDYKLRQRLSKITPVVVPVDIDVNRGALSRLTDALSKIKGPSFGSGINPTGYAMIFAGITAVAAPLFGLLTTALAALPGLIAAIATPITAVMLGLDGFKNAAKSLEAPFTSLKDTMSKVAEETFTPVFEKLAGIFPSLERTMPSVTKGLADMAQSVVDVVTGESGMAKIESTIRNIGAAISRAAPGIGSFTEGMISLAQSFSEKLPDLSDWFNNTGRSFADWVQRITESGDLSRAFDGLGGTLKTILDAVGGWLQEGFEFMKDPKNIEDFNAGLKSIGDSLESIVSLSNSLNNMGDLFKGLMPTFDMTALTDDLFKPFTSENAPWRTMWASFQQTAATAFSAVALQAQMLWSSISTTASTAISGISAAWQGLQGIAAAAFNGVVGVVASVVSQISGLFSQVPAALSSAWSGVVSAAASIFGQVVSAVANAMSQVVAAVVQGGAQVVAEVGSWPGKILAAIGDLAGQLAAAASQAASAFIGALASGIAAGVGRVTGAVGSVLGAIKNLIPNSPAKEGPFSGSGWTQLGKGGAAIVEQFGSGVEAEGSKLYESIKAIMQAIKDVFGSASGINLNFNLGGAQTAMAGIASSAQDFSTAMNTAVPSMTKGANKIDADTRSQLDQLDIEKARLNVEIQRLQAQKNLAGDKGQKSVLQQQIDQLQIQRQQLTMTQQQLEYQSKYSGEVGTTAENYSDLLKQTAGIPMDFAKNVGGQFMSDLGIGGGALTAAVDQGLQFGEQFIFNVLSMDDALSGQQRIQNKKSLQFTQR